MKWPDETIVKLRSLIGDGISSREIAKQLNMTKNMVIGKVHRLGLVLAGTPRSGALELGVRRREAAKTKPVSTTTKPPRRKGKPVVKSVLSTTPMRQIIPIIASDIHPVFDLRPNQCRFPIGDPGKPDFRFCSEVKDGDRPYCPEHCRIAYAGPVRAEISEAQKQMMQLGRIRACAPSHARLNPIVDMLLPDAEL